ncbi:MAG: hypothetical protein OXT70_12655, partial [Chloroflexota bacterium]|nr:hypothetical protein [Chloroflexota bacterium]
DTEDELHDILTVTLSNPVSAALGDPSTAEGMIRDNEGTERPWVRLSIKESSIVEGAPITVQVRSKSVAKQDIDVNFYVWYAHDEYSLGRVERSAWFENPRGTGLQIATIPAGATGIDFIINTRADQANFNGYIAAVMLTPGLLQTEGYQNLGDPDGSIKPHMLDRDSLPYRTATKEQVRVTVRDGSDALSPPFTIKRVGPRVIHAGEPVTFVLSADAVTTADTVVSYEVVAAGGVVAGAEQGIQQITVPKGARIDWITVPTVTTGSGDDHTLSVRLARGAYTRKYYTTDYLLPTSVQEGNVKASVTVRDQTATSRPTAQIATSGDITEGGSATFTVSLDAAQTSRVTVFTRARVIGDYGYNAQFGTWSRSIRSGLSKGFSIDFTIPPGQTEETLTVTTVDDAVSEPDGAITLQIIAIGSPSYTRGTASQAVANVADNDIMIPELSVTAADTGIGEGEDAIFAVSANPAPSADIAVTVTVSATGYFGAATGPQTVTIGGGQTSATLRIETINDNAIESDGSITATIEPDSNHTVSSSKGTASVTVWDEDGIPQGYRVDRDVVNQVKAKDNSYGSIWRRVLIAFGETSKLLSVDRPMTLGEWLGEVSQDPVWTVVAEEFKAFKAVHAAGRGGWGSAQPVARIVAGKSEIEGGHASFAIEVEPPPAADMTVTYTVSQVGDYRSNAGTSFTATVPTSGVLAVHLPTTDDQADEDDGEITIALESSNDYTVAPLQGAATVPIIDNDGPPVLRIWGGPAVTEGTGACFTVKISPAPKFIVRYTEAVTQQGDFLSYGERVSHGYVGMGFATSCYSTTDDQADEPDGAVTVTLTPGSGYAVSSTEGSATVTV